MTTGLRGADLLGALRDRGTDLVTGVPCSYLTPLINAAINDPRNRYVGATSEGEAVAVATGAWLAGGTPLVMAQNSGLGNMVNPLTSLVWPARVPLMLMCTWRGQPGVPDEPQHALMGRVMGALLDTLEVEWEVLDPDPGALGPALDRGLASMERRALPYCYVVRKGVVADQPLTEPAQAAPPRVRPRHTAGHPDQVAGTRAEILERVLALVPDTAALIATTGKTGRELFTLADRPQHFYLVGSMGCASAVGLGVALTDPRPVVVLDGDGAALMKLGNLATIGAHRPSGLVHVLLDNQVHDSTGGQRTHAGTVDFPAVAAACGYRSAVTCRSPAEVDAAIAAALAAPGPHLVHIRIAAGSMPRLGRPTVAPHEVARRFRDHLAATRAPRAALPAGAGAGAGTVAG